MQLDAPTFADSFRFGFFLGIGVTVLMCGLFWGYWLALHAESTSEPRVKSRAASASN
jgi:hypothetical protein